MAYVPNSGSIVAFQQDSDKLTAKVSVVSSAPQSVSGVGLFNVNHTGNGSVITEQKGSVGAFIIGGSISASFTPPANQSVSGTVDVGTLPNSSVQVVGVQPPHSVAALQSTNPWIVQLTSGSVITSGGNSSVQVNNILTGQASVYLIPGVGVLGSVAVLQGTNPWVIGNSSVQVNNIATGNASVQLISTSASIATQVNRILTGVSSVQLMAGTNNAGSITAIQGTNPWATQLTSGSILVIVPGSIGAAIVSGSVAVSTGNSSVMLTPGINAIGSVAVLQGTNPWVVGNSSVQVVGAMPPQSVSGVGLFNVNHTGNGSILAIVPGSVATTFKAASMISGHASTVNSSSGSVLVLPSVQATLYAYLTDFLLSNTGSSTTLVTFTDSDGSIMGKSIAPTGGGAVATAITSPMRTASPGKAVYAGAATATSVLHIWIGGYKDL